MSSRSSRPEPASGTQYWPWAVAGLQQMSSRWAARKACFVGGRAWCLMMAGPCKHDSVNVSALPELRPFQGVQGCFINVRGASCWEHACAKVCYSK